MLIAAVETHTTDCELSTHECREMYEVEYNEFVNEGMNELMNLNSSGLVDWLVLSLWARSRAHACIKSCIVVSCVQKGT